MRLSRRPAISSAVLSIVVIVVLVLAAGAGYYFGQTTSTGTTITSSSAPQNLVDQAKAEGTLVIYGSIEATTYEQTMLAAFKHIYPWANVNYISLTTPEITSRVDSEYKAGKVTADIVAASLPSQLSLLNAGEIQNYSNPMVALMNYSKSEIDPAGYYFVYMAEQSCLIYNTKLVSPQQAPKSILDFTNPIWKGKIAMQNPATYSGSTSVILPVYYQQGNATFTSLINGLLANNPTITSSGGKAYSTVESGAASIGIDFCDDYLFGLSSGSPVGATVLPYFDPNVVMITKSAPHLAMAELYAQFVLSGTGQQAAINLQLVPAFAPMTSISPYSRIISANVTSVNAFGFPGAISNSQQWITYFHSKFG